MHAFTQSVGVVGEPLFHVVVAPDWSSICQKSSQSSFIVASTRIWVWALSRGGKPNKHLGQIETTPDRQMKCNFEQQRSCSYGVEVGSGHAKPGYDSTHDCEIIRPTKLQLCHHHRHQDDDGSWSVKNGPDLLSSHCRVL